MKLLNDKRKKKHKENWDKELKGYGLKKSPKLLPLEDRIFIAKYKILETFGDSEKRLRLKVEYIGTDVWRHIHQYFNVGINQ
jgi:hypothetical protein